MIKNGFLIVPSLSTLWGGEYTRDMVTDRVPFCFAIGYLLRKRRLCVDCICSLKQQGSHYKAISVLVGIQCGVIHKLISTYTQ